VRPFVVKHVLCSSFPSRLSAGPASPAGRLETLTDDTGQIIFIGGFSAFSLVVKVQIHMGSAKRTSPSAPVDRQRACASVQGSGF